MDGERLDITRLRLITPKSPLQIGMSHFRGFALLLGILGLGVIAFYSLGKQSLDAQIRARIETELCQKFAATGQACSIGSARFIPCQGLLLNDVRIVSSNGDDSPIFAIDEIAIASNCGLNELLLRDVVVSSVDIKRAHCVLQRDEAGNWNIESLVKSLSTAAGARDYPPIPIRVRNSSVELRLATENESVTYVIRDVQFVATPNRISAGLAIRGSLAGNGVEQVSFAVDLDPVAQSWSASIAASSAQIDSHMLNILTQSVPATIQSKATFRGVLDLQCTARGPLNALALDQFQLDGKLSEVSFNDPDLPLVVRQGQAEFRVTPSAAHAWNVSAQTDQGSFHGEYIQDGALLAPDSWRVHGDGLRLSVDRRLVPLLPESAKATFNTWSPDGVFDLNFDVTGNANGVRPNLTATLVDASFEYEKFPYRLEHCVGRLELKDECCDIDIQSLEGDHVFRIAGQIRNPGQNYTGFVEVTLDGQVPLDAKVMRALSAQPKSAAVVQSFHAMGQIGIKARLGRETAADEKSQQDFRVQLIDCSLRHERFDYPFHNVNGLLRIRNDRVDVDNVTAVHGNGSVRCDGLWSKSEGLNLQFLARTVSLDDQLRAALNPVARQRWAEFRPRGVVDLVQVNLLQPAPDAITSVTIDAQVFPGGEQSDTSVSMQPSWFPYSIHNIVGRLSIGDDTITLHEVRGDHDQTWMSCNGNGTYDERQWELRITDLYVSGMDANDQLLAALPANVGQAIKRVHWQGLVNARGEVTIAGESRSELVDGTHLAGYVSAELPRADNRSTPRLAWTLQLDSDNAAFDVGFPIEHICGGAKVSGVFDGANIQCAGEIDIDSMMVGPCQINSIRGPIWIDQKQCAIGSLAKNAQPNQTPRSISCDFYAGQLRVDGRIDLTDQQPFFLEANVTSCDMESLSDDLIPRHKNVFGTGYGAVRLAGDRSGRHSWRGEGNVNLRNARIEVPLMSAVGQVVRVADFERTVFDESNVEFEIRGDDVDLNQIEIIGRPISLIGNGKVNHHQKIDLDFYTILGRNKINIPVISDLYHAGSQQFLHIKVDGDLDDPQTHKTVLPGINEPLKKLVEDLEGRRPAVSN